MIITYIMLSFLLGALASFLTIYIWWRRVLWVRLLAQTTQLVATLEQFLIPKEEEKNFFSEKEPKKNAKC